MHPNISKIVSLITSEIRTREDKKNKWANFKNKHADVFKHLLELDHTDLSNPASLMGFDIHPTKPLILLNYTGQAHNELHNIENGWSVPLREMRGLIYDFSSELPILVSRGFEKFFNANELPENTYDSLRKKYSDRSFFARRKEDGHMIEYFVHDGELCATTRGKFETVSAHEALTKFTLDDFLDICNNVPGNIMSIVVELVTPNTEVHVDYHGEESLYLLAAFYADGSKAPISELLAIAEVCPKLSWVQTCAFTLDDMIAEVNDRSVTNQEGWVMDFDGELIKFKYVDYIGRMVSSKLSYKYIMQCLKSERLDKMFYTLPEEVREAAYESVRRVKEVASRAKEHNSYALLYTLYTENEGGREYFRTVCREFYREYVKNAA